NWFGGKTRNPWNPKQGSSGSSAGPASATAAGCVAFSIGSETLGSISSPSTRCGCTGLRPTFGLVPRTGAMALSWSMDKLGPICRSVEDCAIVLGAIAGPDGHDRTVRSAAFDWDAQLDWRALRVGYLKSDFEAPGTTPAPDSAGRDSVHRDSVHRDSARRDSALSDADRAKRETDRRQGEERRREAEYDRRFEQAALATLGRMGVT